ncbi:MAG: hypothetical protein CL946_05425 [Ectothiorhodospiraceae bacterium]|nr:hypothetical protein [Ectothiorhodospiraceae bacterium]
MTHITRTTYLFFAACALAVLLIPAATQAQTEPEAPPSVLEPEETANGWQIGFYGGVAHNEFYEGYRILNVINFLTIERSWSAPFGVSLNIPIFNDASIYLRAGVHLSETNFFNGKYDSLSNGELGAIGFDMDFTFNLVQFDILLRLIGNNDGERVYFGLGLGFVQDKNITLTRSELQTGMTEVLQDQPMPGADDLFPLFIIGGEYALIPLPNLYVIPALEIQYGFQDISTLQDLKAVYYRALVTVSYQAF